MMKSKVRYCIFSGLLDHQYSVSLSDIDDTATVTTSNKDNGEQLTSLSTNNTKNDFIAQTNNSTTNINAGKYCSTSSSQQHQKQRQQHQQRQQQIVAASTISTIKPFNPLVMPSNQLDTRDKMDVRQRSSLKQFRNNCSFRSLLYHLTILLHLQTIMHISELTVGLVHATESRIYQHSAEENSNEFWETKGRKALDEALRYQVNVGRAKNSIIFVGDGMSLSTITAARILHGQMYNNRSGEEDKLSFESFPNLALVKTYNVDQQVPDSAATATAILCGIKSNFYTLGVNANVRLNDTDCQNIQRNHVQSIIQKAIKAGKSTGIVTNTR